jgi:hypothetical protein
MSSISLFHGSGSYTVCCDDMRIALGKLPSIAISDTAAAQTIPSAQSKTPNLFRDWALGLGK